MYIPKLHEETDLPTLHALIRERPLGTWITQGDGELIVNHVPFLIEPALGPYGTLHCHVARANPVWRQFSSTVTSAVVFHGPNAYISPSYYPSKQLHGKVVPTWNYVVVHAHGIPTVFEDASRLVELVTRLTDTHESPQTEPWKVSDAPAEFIEQMARQIVGIEIPISKLVGKWKVSQNRSPADRQGVITRLRASTNSELSLVADVVEQAK